MKIVIIGGVAGGMSAATRMRRLNEEAEIIVLERGKYVSFANCGLPYYVGGVIPEREDLVVQTPESLRDRFALDVRTQHEVLAIDPAQKQITVRDLRNGALYVESYDALILAAGAKPVDQIPGHGVPVRNLHTLEDVDAIVTAVEAKEARDAVVIGAGFIGLEAAENLRRRGLEVTIVQRGKQVFSPLDPEMAAPLIRTLQGHGVRVLLEQSVEKLDDHAVWLRSGEKLRADVVVDARGVRPNAQLAADAGLQIGATGGITVNPYQRTSDPAIYAVGDGVEKVDAVDDSPTLVTMAGLANRHGRAAADAIMGVARPARAAFGASIIGIFDLTVAMVGWSERRVIADGRPYRVLHTHPVSHGSYYPGAQRMQIKLVIDAETDNLLGAQIVGGEGVDKRIDVIATAMAAGMTASSLSELELAYAPQFSSAKDAVNLAGYVAENLASGATRTIQWHELDAALASGATLVDVRSPAEYAAAAIPGSINVPLEELRERLDDLPAGPLIVHCQVGQRGHTAARLLSQHGIDVRNLDGGYLTWVDGTQSQAHETAPAIA